MIMKPRYEFFNVETGEIITRGDDNLVEFGGEWGILQGKGLARWREVVVTLEEVKADKIREFSEAAFSLRENLVPSYQLTNAALGVYEGDPDAPISKAQAAAVVVAFRNEFYRLRALVQACDTKEAVQAVEANWSSSVPM